MDNLTTCMICDISFKTNEDVVVTYDAKYLGFEYSDDIASFERHEVMGGPAPERGVYCTDCYAKLASYSWELAKQVSENIKETS